MSVPPPGPPRPTAPSSPPRRRGFLPLAVGAVVVALLCGGAVGAGAGLLTSEPDGSATVPPFPAAFPHGDQQFLAGVTVPLVVDDWLKHTNKWTCEAMDQREIDDRRADVQMCRPPRDGGDLHVIIVYEAADKVREIEATCWEDIGAKACKVLFSTMADTVFVPQRGLREQASEWSVDNEGAERSTVIGEIRLETRLDPNALRITPAV